VRTIGSLFAGIGGFDLGLERTGGFRTAWFCERDEFCSRVLAHHWPGVPCYPDITALRGADIEPVDVVVGGFPCQDLSYAGAGAGLDGARSGLWSEYARLIGELGPRYVVVENVAALLARGLGTVLADLAALGYDAEWDCIPASAVGAPHRRDRIWLVAYPGGEQHEGPRVAQRWAGTTGLLEAAPDVADTARDLRTGAAPTGAERQRARESGQPGGASPDADRGRLQERGELHGGQDRPELEASQRDDADRLRAVVADAERPRLQGRTGSGRPGAGRTPVVAASEREGDGGHWLVEPDVGRVAHGVPARVDRLRSLGNALVPQIAEWIGHRIIEHEEGRVAA
jgi:DNA (cytosine-5)-methyltransferase 1